MKKLLCITALIGLGTILSPYACAQRWETLIEKPIPDDAQPKISVFSVTLPPAPAVPPSPGPGHTHLGPVFVYIVEGRIENQVEPDPAAIYTSGSFFYETPQHVHKFIRNLSTTDPAKIVIFQAGDPGRAAPPIKLLLEAPFQILASSDVTLLRLTLPPATSAEAPPSTSPSAGYVLGGMTSSATNPTKLYKAGEVFLEPANGAPLRLTNVSMTDSATILLYQVRHKR